MRLSFFSSLNFPWKPQADDSEEYALSSKDKAVPLYRYRGRATETANPDLFNLAALPLFLSGVRNAHTSLRQWLEQQYTSAEITHISYVPEGRELLTDLKLPTPEQIASRETFSRTYLITCTIEYRYRQDGFFSWSYGNTFRRSSDTVTETWTATAYTD